MAYTRANYVDWPRCVDAIVDWAGKFDGESQVSPRMAHRLFSAACEISDTLLDNVDFPPRLPACTGRSRHPGAGGSSSATGESPAQLHRRGDGPLRNFSPSRRSGQGWDGWWWVPCHQIHSNPFDEDFRDVLSSLVEDEDVLMLFDDGDDGYSSDEGGGADDILHPRSLATEILGNLGEMANVVNLNPEEWFLAFKEEDMQRHVVWERS